MIWHDIYDMVYLTAIGLPPGGSSTVHMYTQTTHRTTQSTQTIHRTTQLKQRTTQLNIEQHKHGTTQLCHLFDLENPLNTLRTGDADLRF